MRGLRRTLAAAGLMTRRRGRRDVTILLAWTTLIAFVVLLAVEGPHLLVDTVDNGARQAVAAAGSKADFVATTPVGQRNASSQVPVLFPKDFLRLAAAIPRRLPAGLSTVSPDSVVTVLGPQTPVVRIDGTPRKSGLDVQVGMLTAANLRELKLESGRLPAASPSGDGAEDVVLGGAAARASGLVVGSTFTVGAVKGTLPTASGAGITLRVVGIVAERGSSQRRDLPDLWTPSATLPARTVRSTLITVLATQAGVTDIAPRYRANFTGVVRVRVDAARFTGALERSVNAEITTLVGNDQSLVGSSGAVLTTTSGFGAALDDFPSQSRAALAQMSILIAGVLGVAAAVLVLLSRLLVLRRNGETLLERARGSSLAALGARSLLESVLTTAVGTLVGVGVALVIRPGPPQDFGILVVVVLIALLATPVQTMLATRAAWSGRKSPANRRDRAERDSRIRARRLALEITVVALGVAALLSIASRGLLETTTAGIDPLLASAPLLFAVITTIVLLRIYPWPVRAIAAIGRRARGALGLLGATRAVRAVTALPLLALTLAVALAVSGGLLIATVSAGQVSASWQRVGADIRVDAPVTDAGVAALRAEPGVTAAAAARVDTDVQTKLGTSVDFVTLVSVDSNFSALVHRLPAGTMGGSDPASLALLRAPTDASDALPVIVDAEMARELITKNISMYYGQGLVSLRVVGVTSIEPNGYLAGDFMYVDRGALSARIPGTVHPNLLLITGGKAAKAASTLGVAHSAIHNRATWLRDRRSLALVSGTQTTMLLSTAALALLAAIALIATVLAGSRDRGRSVSLLRTLGMRARLGWWLALAELAPLIVAALVGGTLSGVWMVVLLEPSLGLDVLAGGEYIPPTVVSPLLIIGLAAATIVLLVVSVLVEILAQRRDKLSEVLRVGETV